MAGKKYLIPLVTAFLATAASSCVREVFPNDSGEITLNVDGSGLDLVFETKTTALASLPSSLYWGATQGSPTESSKWASRSGSVTDSKIYTGEFQSDPPVAYTYYVSNLTMSIGENTTVSAVNTTDVICGRGTSTTSCTPSVVLNHIYSRTGTLTLTLPAGYSSSAVTWEIKAKGDNTGTTGTFNLRTDAWSGTSGVSDFTAFTSSSDLYLIPGEYMVQISFTATKGDFSRSYVEEGTITMVAGKICNITAVSTTDEAPLSISVSLTPWGGASQDLSHTSGDYFSFGGLQIAPGNLYYDGTTYQIADYPLDGIESSRSKSGMIEGSYYHSWNEMADFFSTNDAGTGTFTEIDNKAHTVSWGGYRWRMPTRMEMEQYILGTNRTGAVVNGSGSKHYAAIVVTCPGTGTSTSAGGDSTYGSGYQYGVLVFPDDVDITTSVSFAGYDNASSLTTGVTMAQFDDLLDQGCIFLPGVGRNKNGTWEYTGSYLFDWVTSCSRTDRGDAEMFHSGSNTVGNSVKSTNWFTVRLVCDGPDYLLPGVFSVAADKQVRFTSGNLRARIGSTVHDSYLYDASSWMLAPHQYEYIGNAVGNTTFGQDSIIDLFNWVGESASYDSYGITTVTSSGNAYLGTVASEDIKTDWGEVPGVMISIGEGYGTLSHEEWSYLINTRENAASKVGTARIYDGSSYINGLLLLPDNWVAPEGFTFTPGTGDFSRNTYDDSAASGTANAWCDIEDAGAVFLPAAGYFTYSTSVYDGTVNVQGAYWTSSGASASNAYDFWFYTSTINADDNSARFRRFSVRLVKTYTAPSAGSGGSSITDDWNPDDLVDIDVTL